jgi:hypothetical protein
MIIPLFALYNLNNDSVVKSIIHGTFHMDRKRLNVVVVYLAYKGEITVVCRILGREPESQKLFGSLSINGVNEELLERKVAAPF